MKNFFPIFIVLFVSINYSQILKSGECNIPLSNSGHGELYDPFDNSIRYFAVDDYSTGEFSVKDPITLNQVYFVNSSFDDRVNKINSNSVHKFLLPDLNGNGSEEIIYIDRVNYPYRIIIIDLQTLEKIFSLDDPIISYSLDEDWGGLYCYDDKKLILHTLTTNTSDNTRKKESYLIDYSSLTTNIIHNGNLVKEFSLEQNYPNPFNPTTTIEYTIPQSGNVTIRIFDITGSVVYEVLNSHSVGGNYSMVWNGKNSFGDKASSGTYFYQLVVNDQVKTKKMILLK